METAGGGWTLVATINEQSIESGCTAEDRWISNSPLSPTDPYGIIKKTIKPKKKTKNT